MTENNLAARVRLGPNALRVIEGRGENRQVALEEAIADLEQGVEHAQDAVSKSHAARVIEQSLADAVLQGIGHQAERLTRLEAVLEVEMRMMRALIASLMSTSDEAQRKIMEIAVRASEEMRKPTAPKGLHTSLEQDEQDQQNRQIMMREMERGADHGPRPKEEGLER